MKPHYLIFFLSLTSISAHSAIVQWNIEFVQPVIEGSLEASVTGQGNFSYDTSTIGSAHISDDSFLVPVYAYEADGTPFIAYYDSFHDSKNGINTLLTDLTINNLGIEWNLSDGTPFFPSYSSERWWKDDLGTETHGAGSVNFVGTGADSYFSSSWLFGPYNSNIDILPITINSSTAFGHWTQNNNGITSEGTWSAQIISTPIPGAFYLFASGLFGLIHLGKRKAVTPTNSY